MGKRAIMEYLTSRGYHLVHVRDGDTRIPSVRSRNNYGLVFTDAAGVWAPADMGRSVPPLYATVVVSMVNTKQPSLATRMSCPPFPQRERTEHVECAIDTSANVRRTCRRVADYYRTAISAPSLIVVDNSKNLSVAKMTPRLIAYIRSIRGIHCIVINARRSLINSINNSNVVGIVLSGGPLLLSERTMLHTYNKNILALLMAERKKLPVLGICFGMQIMASSHGGHVSSMGRKIHGYERVRVISGQSTLFQDDQTRVVFSSHQNRVSEIPPGFIPTSVDSNGSVQSIENDEYKLYGVQFHPEGTREGYTIIDRFLSVCGVYVPKL